MPYLGIQVEPVDLSIRAGGQLVRPLQQQGTARLDPPARGERRLWILPLPPKSGSAGDTKARHSTNIYNTYEHLNRAQQPFL
jgi:hypothetical protein